MMKLGLCCGGGGLCCVVLGAVLWFGGGTAVFGETGHGAGCSKIGCAKQATAGAPCKAFGGEVEEVELTADEQKIVTYIADMVEDGKAPMIDSETVENELGLSAELIEQLDESRLRAGVMAELSRRNFDVASLGGNCSRYNACSVDRNLMNATGEELERYKEEVALDGTSFASRVAPDFTLPDTEGRQVSLSDYRGQNVAVVFLSAHCYHSLDTLPILAELKQKYDDEQLAILPVFINSGDVEDIKSRAYELDVTYPLIVAEGKEISALYDSRMVPSTFLIDAQGNLVKKFVGFKDRATLDEAFGEFVSPG
jgi:peroxiredoxin